MNVGYVGLGNMGGALAARLQQSGSLVVFDRDEDMVRRMVDLGASAAKGLADLAARCDLVFLCLPTSDHTRSVIFGSNGADGLIHSMRAGTVIVDQTTGDPLATRAMADELLASGIFLIDAPVSGGITGAQAGTIAIMVGADSQQFDVVRPVLEQISPNIFHAGGVGNGQVVKLVNNLMSGAQRLLTLEAVALAAKNGVEPTVAHEILMAGGARNSYLEKIFGPKVLQGDLNVGFTLGLMHKDVRLACDLARVSGTPLFFGGLTRELYQLCIAENGAHAQVETAALLAERWAGTSVVPDPTRK
jgi:3-hydroxyisobutyrate dehydrogenase